jgi:hypothetical protein
MGCDRGETKTKTITSYNLEKTMNWMQSLETAEVDVAIKIFDDQMTLNFARIPDVTVMNDLNLLNKRPGYCLYESKTQPTQFFITFPPTVKKSTFCKAVEDLLKSHSMSFKTEVFGIRE